MKPFKIISFISPQKQIMQPHQQCLELHCCLVQYDFPLLGQCYILCHTVESNDDVSKDQLLQFAQQEAERISFERTQSSQNFMLAISGANIRKTANWHIHIFIVESRWQKAYVYQLLAIKNLGLSLLESFKR